MPPPIAVQPVCVFPPWEPPFARIGLVDDAEAVASESACVNSQRRRQDVFPASENDRDVGTCCVVMDAGRVAAFAIFRKGWLIVPG